jgi:hypothetical protein
MVGTQMALGYGFHGVFIKQSTSWPMTHCDWPTTQHVRHRGESRGEKQRFTPFRFIIQ